MNIVLSSQDYYVTVNTLGAELKSYRDPSGREYVWNSDPAYWMRSSPLLFPTVGNVRDNKTQFNGVEYSLPKHGFCKESEFTVRDQTENSVVFVLAASDETKKSYPFNFELQLKYQLNGSSLSMTYTVLNRDKKEMYYHIGAHPGFMCPLNEGESLSDYVLEFEKEERLESTVYDLENLCFDHARHKLFAEHARQLPLTAEMFDDDAVFFPHTASHAVSLVNPKPDEAFTWNTLILYRLPSGPPSAARHRFCAWSRGMALPSTTTRTMNFVTNAMCRYLPLLHPETIS